MTTSLGDTPVWHGRLVVTRRQVLVAVIGLGAVAAMTVVLHVLSHGGSFPTLGFLWFSTVVGTLGIPARLQVEPSGVRIMSWLGFSMRQIARSAILSAEVVPIEVLPVDLAERDRYVRGDGDVLLLRLESGATIALSASAPWLARAAIEATPREGAPPARQSRLLPPIAADGPEYRRHLTLLGVLPTAIAIAGIVVVVAVPGPSAGQTIAALVVVVVLLAMLGAAVISIGRAPVNLRARGSTDFDVRAKLTLGAIALLLTPSAAFALVASLVGSYLAGSADVDDLASPGLLPALAGAAALLPVSWLMLRRLPDEPEFDVSVPTMVLEPTERAIWIGRTPLDRRITTIWLTIGIAPLLLAVAFWPFDRFAACLMVVPLVIAVGALLLAPRFVHIDETGFRVVAFNGIPRAFIPLDQIEYARVDQVTLGDDWWGSGRARRRLITRAGEAVEVGRSTRMPLVVTVDSSPEAVAVLRALIARD